MKNLGDPFQLELCIKMQPLKKIVVKVGTSTLTHDNGRLNLRRIDRLVRTLSDLKSSGLEVILVSSGAIAVGVSRLGLGKRPSELHFRQAAAAVGQCELMYIYERLFAEYGYSVGQILLTHEDVAEKTRRQNLINTFMALIELGTIPIVNENDSVTTEELSGLHIGDNDNLSAIVADLCEASLLIMLTDIDGLYDSDPSENPDARLIPVVDRIDDEIISMAGGAGTNRGTGGMMTKVSAARFCMKNGIDAVVASGDNPGVLYGICEGKHIGTLFRAPRRREQEKGAF